MEKLKANNKYMKDLDIRIQKTGKKQNKIKEIESKKIDNFRPL